MHNGTAYVGIRASAWEDVVAKRITSNDLNRMRARSILELRDEAAAADSIAATFKRDADGYRDRLAAQIAETNKVQAQLDKASRKVRNRTPWARAAQGVVGLVVLGAIGKGVNAIAPGTIPML